MTRESALRHLQVLHLVRSRRAAPTLRGLAEQFGCCERTVKRDIRHLRDAYQAPIVYDAAARGYRMAAPVSLEDLIERSLLL